MKKILLVFLLIPTLSFSQKNFFESVAVDSLEDSIYVDLGLDTYELQSNYEGGDEFRVLGIICEGTWTNDTLEVYASETDGGTYYQVKNQSGSALIVVIASNTWVWFTPNNFATLRYILFKTSAGEADSRTLKLIKRQF